MLPLPAPVLPLQTLFHPLFSRETAPLSPSTILHLTIISGLRVIKKKKLLTYDFKEIKYRWSLRVFQVLGEI